MARTNFWKCADAPRARRWHTSALACIALAALWLPPAAAAGEHWRLVFRVSETKTTYPSDPPPGSGGESGRSKAKREDRKPTVEEREYTWTVELGSDYHVLTADEGREIYDFRAGRAFMRSGTAQELSDHNLHALVAFRVNELQNRVSLGAMFRAVGVKDARVSFDAFDSESLFGLQIPGVGTLDSPKAQPACKLRKGRQGLTEFVREGRVVAAYRHGTLAVPEEWRRPWERFLVYACSVHPSVRETLMKDGRIPQRLEYSAINTFQRSDYVVDFVSAEIGEERRPAERIAGEICRSPVPSKRLRDILARLPDSTAPSRQAAVEFADRAIHEGRAIDAMLALVEHTLQSGESMADEIRARVDVFNHDDRCRQYFSSGDQSSREACEQSEKGYAAIDRTALEKAYVIDIMRANALTGLNRLDEAEAFFLAALEANPFIGGVYNDLGGLYYGSYDMSAAWVCWDTARRLYPGHKMLEGVTDLEQRLQKDFPIFY